MKKFTILVLLLGAMIRMSYAQNNKHTFERGSVIQSNKVFAYFFIGSDLTHQYWGCPDSTIKWRPHMGTHQVITDNGDTLNMLPLKAKYQQNNLTIIFSQYITEKHLTERQAFKKIFEYYQKFGNSPADWTILLLGEG